MPAEDGWVDTTWDAQLPSFWHALARTPKRQAPVIQTQIVLALVGAMVMLVARMR